MGRGVIVKGGFCKARTKVGEGEATEMAPTGCKDLKRAGESCRQSLQKWGLDFAGWIFTVTTVLIIQISVLECEEAETFADKPTSVYRVSEASKEDG